MLKKVTLFAGAMFACSLAFAQSNSQRVVGTAHQTTTLKSVPTSVNRPSSVSCSDTMNWESVAAQPTYYTTSNQGAPYGYVFGTNGYEDKAKANQFVSSGTKTITGALFAFAVATESAAGGSMVNIKVWDSSGAAGAPGAVVATKSVPLSDIVADVDSGFFTIVTFDTPANVTGNFYMGFDIPTNWAGGDTLALYQTSPTTNTSPNLAWEQWSDDTWHSFTSAWAANFTVSGLILPFVEYDLTAGFTFPSTLNLANGNTVTFTNTSTGGTMNSWSIQGGTPNSSTATSPTATFNTAGTYTIELTHSSASGCMETITQTLTVTGTVGAEEDLANAVNLYPNPASSVLNLSGVTAKNVVITNAIGQVVSQQNVSATNTVNVANLSSGMYYVQIETAEGTITKKVSVQK